MVTPVTNKDRWERIWQFFPFQLLALHFKKNHLLLLFWFFLFGYVSQYIGTKYGIHMLFLFPEYLNQVNFWSYFIIGVSIGGFIMAFNLYSYIMHGFRFPFIATVSKPFFKFSINNFIIPFLFIAVYCYNSFQVQFYRELLPISTVVFHLLGFILGITTFIIIGFAYFFRTNKDVDFFKENDKKVEKSKEKLEEWFSPRMAYRTWRVKTYLQHPFSISLAREAEHYDHHVLNKVLTQNHVNAALFELVSFVTFIIIGAFSALDYFIIPAASSLVLLFTMYLMLVSALFNWFKGWTMTIMFVSFFIINVGHNYFSFLGANNHAYGLDYSKVVPYEPESVENMRLQTNWVEEDTKKGIEILENWKNRLAHLPTAVKQTEKITEKKPKLVFISTSGGGLRAALWTFYALQLADSLCHQKLLPHTKLITGSSGGMIGASYIRELYLKKQQENFDFYNSNLGEKLGADILNPVVFSIATNDLFIRYRKVEYGNFKYTIDRGYAFEKGLNENTNGFLDKKLSDYTQAEYDASIPQFVLTPTIVNDGRRLLISSTPVSYLVSNQPDNPLVYNKPILENVELSRFLPNNGVHNLSFLSALRMSATFPYILPTVSLPTEPTIEIMDAGLRDNFGMLSTIKYMFTFREWIEENTSGVVILQVRDKVKNRKFNVNKVPSIIEKLASPVQALYTNFERVQNFEHDKLIEYAGEWFNSKVDVIDLELTQKSNQSISLSWHLTALEKQQIKNAVYNEKNKDALEHLNQLLH